MKILERILKENPGYSMVITFADGRFISDLARLPTDATSQSVAWGEDITVATSLEMLERVSESWNRPDSFDEFSDYYERSVQ